jgi:hypothetical protein
MGELTRPSPNEFAPYFARYIDLVPNGDIVETLTLQLGETLGLLQAVTPEQPQFRFARSIKRPAPGRLYIIQIRCRHFNCFGNTAAFQQPLLLNTKVSVIAAVSIPRCCAISRRFCQPDGRKLAQYLMDIVPAAAVFRHLEPEQRFI